MHLIRRQILLPRSYSTHFNAEVSGTAAQVLHISLNPSQKIQIDPEALLYIDHLGSFSYTQESPKSFIEKTFSSFLSIASRPKAKSGLVSKDKSIIEISNSDPQDCLRLVLNSNYPSKILKITAEPNSDLYCKAESFLCGDQGVLVENCLYPLSGDAKSYLKLQKISGQGVFFIKGGVCATEIELKTGEFIRVNDQSLLGFRGVKIESNEMLKISGPGTVYIQGSSYGGGSRFNIEKPKFSFPRGLKQAGIQLR